jgi:hypothetical protein
MLYQTSVRWTKNVHTSGIHKYAIYKGIKMRLLFAGVSSLVLLAHASFAADPLDQWRWRNPLPNGDLPFAVTYADGKFVGVGDAGAVGISWDGTNWASYICPPLPKLPGATYGLGAITTGNGMFVGVGSGQTPGVDGSYGVVVSSPDGTNWSIPSRITVTPGLSGIAYGNGRFVAVGTYPPGAGTVLTSVDGAEWISQGHVSNDWLESITYGNGIFVVGGFNGTILTSSDGFQWADHSLPVSTTVGSVAFGDGIFVVIAGGVYTSSDGSTWTKRLTSYSPSCVGYGAGKFVAGGIDGTVFTSANATNWIKCNSGNTAPIWGFAYGHGTFVAICLGTVLTSTDGVNWSSLGGPPLADPLANYTDVTYGNGSFVAVGGEFADVVPILTSVDGVKWNTHSYGTYVRLSGVAFGNGIYVAMGKERTVCISTNGSNWAVNNSGLNDPTSICFGNGRFVAYGNPGNVMISTNAVNWIAHDLGITSGGTLAFGKGTFVLAGSNGLLLTSTNGEQWGILDSGTVNHFGGVAYGNGNFVATAPRRDIYSVGSVVTSTNGIDWVATTNNAVPGGKLCYGHGYFVGIGGNGAISTSTNGLDWVARDLGTANSLGGIAYGKRTFVTVGMFGRILQSAELPPGELVLGPVEALTNGAHAITGTGTPGENWQMQGSADLIHWTPLADLFSPDPEFKYIDNTAANLNWRFYRAMSQ